ncbi:MAG: hypothetical protein HYY49_10330 [Ignavibacteriales bacterium]|nr:hypothetical protein [Ignavibacteriales bacterium]
MNWFEPNSLQLIVSDLNAIAADAYKHRIRPVSKKGGGGAYNTSKGGYAYVLPAKLETNRRARFAIQAISADFILIQAVCLTDASLSITAMVDDRGTLRELMYPGKPATPPAPQEVERISVNAPRTVTKVFGDL